MANSFQNEQVIPELVTIAELAENLIYRLPGCSDIMVRKTIQEVYREFCRETKCLTAGRIYDLLAGTTEYPVGATCGGVVGEVREVFIDNRKLTQGRDYDAIDGICPLVRLAPRFVDFTETDAESTSPTIAPSPWGVAEEHVHSAVRKLLIIATEYPKMNSEQTPHWFIEKHGDAICSGVLARLMAMTGKAWSDAQQASDERMRYENFKSETRMYKETPAGGRFIDTSMVL